ncbi:MAG TPA: ATP-binding protein [Burkholderiaceae bacterium]
MAQASRAPLSPWLGVTDADRAALLGLLDAACALSGAAAAWWQDDALTCWPADRAGLGNPAALLHTAACSAPADGPALTLVLAGSPAPPATAPLDAIVSAANALLAARSAAQASERDAERLLDAGRVATDWLWESDPDGRVVWMTESILSATGRSAAAEIGTQPMDVNRPRTDEYAASYQRYLADRAARRPIRDLVLDRDTANGTITVLINGNPRFDASGQFLGYRGATRNITAEIRAREQARQSHELLRLALEGMSASVMISAPDGRILMANQRWHGSVGKDLPAGCDTWEGVIRHHARSGHYPDAAGREEQYVAWRLAQSDTQASPRELRWKEHWVLSADQRLPDGSAVHLSIDISDRKRAEHAFKRADERWRYALEGAGHGVWDWDRQLGMYASPSLLAMLGYGEAEVPLSSATWRDLLHEADRARVLEEVARHVRGGSATYEVEYRLRHRDGHYLWIHDRGRVLARDERGRVLRILGTQSDITRLREADQALRDKHAAEALSRRTSEFLARMSHEMRTPLNAVIGFAELLHLRGEYQADQVEHILAAARHLLTLINDVLDLQQVEQGSLALREGAVDADALVREVAALLRPQAHKHGVLLHPALAAEAWVRADAQRLRQVLLNLGSNAIKYNRSAGEVRWSVDAGDPARLGLVTADTGPGLDASQLNRLFQPFERLGREGSEVEGSGLGLLIARRLVEAMSGTLALDSMPGVGTRVTVWLARAAPVSAASVAAPAADAPGVALSAAGARRRVLYVEDNPLNVLLFEEALRRESGIELRVAVSGEQALGVIDGWTPELLVIDLNLPGLTGTELLQALRLRPVLAAVPAIVCSADAMPEDRQRALDAGFDHYWTKPIDVRALPGAIAAALRGEFAPRPASEAAGLAADSSAPLAPR